MGAEKGDSALLARLKLRMSAPAHMSLQSCLWFCRAVCGSGLGLSQKLPVDNSISS